VYVDVEDLCIWKCYREINDPLHVTVEEFLKSTKNEICAQNMVSQKGCVTISVLMADFEYTNKALSIKFA